MMWPNGGILWVAIGLAASASLDLPSGALLVWSLAILAVMMEFVGSLRSIR